jgi:threonine synthase
MEFASTRGREHTASFSQAILEGIPPDGGLYTVFGVDDFRNWVVSMRADSSFAAIAGRMTGAFMQDEYSPAVAETITHKAFPFSPQFKQLDDSLYLLEMFHGPSGQERDFGFAYFASCLEHILQMRQKTAVIIAVSSGSFAASIARAVKDKNRIKAFVLFPKGGIKGIAGEDCVWNGGNVYPVEVDSDIDECYALARQIIEDRELALRYSLTMANTANIGRLLPHTFCYFYAFTRLKERIHSDIFYAVEAGNYGSLAAGLYAWRFALPVNGFITNCTNELIADTGNKANIVDAIVPLEKRTKADPAHPSNLERLESIFRANPAVLRGLVFPAHVDNKDTALAHQELFASYGLLLEPGAARAYAAAKKRLSVTGADDGVVVLVAHNHAALYAGEVRRLCGETPKLPEELAVLRQNVKPRKTVAPNADALVECLKELV